MSFAVIVSFAITVLVNGELMGTQNSAVLPPEAFETICHDALLHYRAEIREINTQAPASLDSFECHATLVAMEGPR